MNKPLLERTVGKAFGTFFWTDEDWKQEEAIREEIAKHEHD